MMSEEKKKWLEEMRDPSFAALSQVEMAERLGFARESINKWCREFPWREVASGQFETLGRKIGPLLDVLYKKGLKGSLPAIEMILELLGLLENKLTIEVEQPSPYDSMSYEDAMVARILEQGGPSMVNRVINKLKAALLAMNPSIGQLSSSGPFNLPAEYIAQKIDEGAFPFRMSADQFIPAKLIAEGFPGDPVIDVTPALDMKEGQKCNLNGNIGESNG